MAKPCPFKDNRCNGGNKPIPSAVYKTAMDNFLKLAENIYKTTKSFDTALTQTNTNIGKHLYSFNVVKKTAKTYVVKATADGQKELIGVLIVDQANRINKVIKLAPRTNYKCNPTDSINTCPNFNRL